MFKKKPIYGLFSLTDRSLQIYLLREGEGALLDSFYIPEGLVADGQLKDPAHFFYLLKKWTQDWARGTYRVWLVVASSYFSEDLLRQGDLARPLKDLGQALPKDLEAAYGGLFSKLGLDLLGVLPREVLVLSGLKKEPSPLTAFDLTLSHRSFYALSQGTYFSRTQLARPLMDLVNDKGLDYGSLAYLLGEAYDGKVLHIQIEDLREDFNRALVYNFQALMEQKRAYPFRDIGPLVLVGPLFEPPFDQVLSFYLGQGLDISYLGEPALLGSLGEALFKNVFDKA
ncbi:MAG: hypothetical protein Q4E37_06345 [Tissierellia bacterium]|nr:hypothetical protein [Tissierellia bacterium]